jgi:hypothetical protein
VKIQTIFQTIICHFCTENFYINEVIGIQINYRQNDQIYSSSDTDNDNIFGKYVVNK